VLKCDIIYPINVIKHADGRKEQAMKNFLKKYPKRVITAFLVVLLIAVVGTVNNYPTYGGYGNKPRDITRSTFKYLEDIYGEGTIFYAEDVPTWYADKMSHSGVYYKAAEDRYIYLVGKGKDWIREQRTNMTLDKYRYSKNDTIVAQLHPYFGGNVEFNSNEYILEFVQNGIWYCVHTGEIGDDITGELIELKHNGRWEFSIDLSAVREVSDEPIRLQRGRYRLTKPATLKRIEYYDGKRINKVRLIYFSCEFTIR